MNLNAFFHRSAQKIVNASQNPSRRHLVVFHATWILLLLGAAWGRFSLPLTPNIDPDFRGFLLPAVKALTGHPFEHYEGRAILYPSLVYALLGVFRDFRAITIFHHGLGLATGLLLLATWCAARRALRPARIPLWLYDFAGLAMFTLFLFSPKPIQFEFLIRPDVICPFFAALSLFLLGRFLLAWQVERNSRAIFGFAVAAIFVSFIMPFLKPSFWLSAIFTTIPVGCALFDRREKPPRRLLMVALPLTAVGLLLILPERLSSRHDIRNATFLPESIFSIHALIIRDQLAADLAVPDPTVPYPPEKLRATLALLDAGIASAKLNSPHHMPSLGFDADWLLYRDPFFIKMAEADHWKMKPTLDLYRYYYRRTWQKMPGPMLHKVGIQLGLFYNLDCPAYRTHGKDMQFCYAITDKLLEDPPTSPIIEEYAPALVFRESVAQLKDHETKIPVSNLFRRTLMHLSHWYLPGLIAYLAALPWICWRAERRARFGVFAALLATGYALNFGNNLGIAVLHTLEISRYTFIQFATTILTEMLTGIFLIEVLCDIAEKFYRPPGAPST